uniref:C3H1-type domain-containing protein n=1 Tax=Arundo donax TaxID=35708 RepID=A0A0A9DVH5_ARUDO
MNEVAVAHGNNEIFQRGTTPGEENMNQANSGAATDWVLLEQVKSKPHDVSIYSVAEKTGVAAWQPPANQSLNVGTAWSTSQNLYLSGGEKAAPSSNSSWEASRKQECTASSVCSGEAIGNTTKGCNPPGSANRGSQRSHHRDRYSQISESWLLSSNHTRSRSDRFGSGGSSRSTSKGQTRGVCKFHESGHCRKGASCSYLHPAGEKRI